jgi:hypothetical protein
VKPKTIRRQQLFSVFYFFQRYVLTPWGVATIAVLALLLWGSQNLDFPHIESKSSSTPDGLIFSTVLIAVLFGCIVCALVGAVIDGRRGALWGFFLGPVGWVIASIRRLERRAPANPTVDESTENEPKQTEPAAAMPPAFDGKKWAILKDVDLDIKAASDRVSDVDPRLDALLAEQYLCLSDKKYLQPLVDNLLSGAHRKGDIGSQTTNEAKPGLYEAPGLFRIRVLPDGSVTVLSGPSGELADYDRFDDLEKFLTAHSADGIHRGLLRRLD